MDKSATTGLTGLNRRQIMAGGVALAGLATLNMPMAFAQGGGGTLRIAQGADAQPKNILAGRAGNNSWRHQVFDSLIMLDSETGEPVPVLATDWEQSEDGKTFKIRIREDVTFHSGRPMTADDVVFTLEQVKIPESASQMAPLVRAYTTITASAPNEVTITSETPVAPRVFDVFQLAVILDKDTFTGLADGSQVIGTGPFKWVEWIPGASLRLERNESYWAEQPVILDGVEISVISDSTAMANAMRGRVDLVLSMTPRDAIMFRGNPTVDLFEAPGAQIYPLGLNVTSAPFDKKELRQAIGFAIDRQRIIDQVFNGIGNPTPLWWRSNEPGTTEAMLNHYHYDPDRARELIAAAGAEGAQIEISVIGLAPVPAIYEIVQNNLREVGLNPVGKVLETAAFDQGQTAGDLGQAFQQVHGLQGFSAATLVDALPALRDTNPSKFTPSRYRELKDALQSAQGDSYAAALTELGEYMLDEAFSHILLHASPLNAKTVQLQNAYFDNVGFLHLGTATLNG